MNEMEALVKDGLEAAGYQVARSGWPDFLIAENGTVICAVEVKDGFDVPSRQQKIMHILLRQAGIKVHVINRGDLEAFIWGMRARLKGPWLEEARLIRQEEAYKRLPPLTARYEDIVISPDGVNDSDYRRRLQQLFGKTDET